MAQPWDALSLPFTTKLTEELSGNINNDKNMKENNKAGKAGLTYTNAERAGVDSIFKNRMYDELPVSC